MGELTNVPAWVLVRDTLKALDDPTAVMPSDSFAAARLAFQEIETDVERLIQELKSNQVAERELRAALEEPGGAETQRR